MFNSVRKLIWSISSQIDYFKGKERIVALLSRPKFSNQIIIKRQGVIWNLQGHDINEFYIAVRNNHSSLLSSSLIKEINNHKITNFWDIGANIGAISLPLLKKFNQLEAILFEPSAEVAGRLIRNIAQNPDLHPRVKILTIALSDSNGIDNFYVSNETFNSGVAGLGHSDNRYKFAVGVQTYTGDSLIMLKKYSPPQLIKIDVEGFELEVFKGLKNTLLEYHPTIIFEHSLYRLKERNQSKNSVTDFLESLGYSIFNESSNKKIIESDLDNDSDFIARFSD
jgi:FkbM family methyltransferase